MINRVTGSGASSSSPTTRICASAAEIAVRERRGDQVAAVVLLDRHPGVRRVLAHRRDHRGRIERPLVHDLAVRKPSVRAPLLQTTNPPAGRPNRSATGLVVVPGPAGRQDHRHLRGSPAYGVDDRGREPLVVVDQRPIDVQGNGCRPRQSVICQPVRGPRGRRRTGAVRSAPGPSRRPAGASPGWRRSSGWWPACRSASRPAAVLPSASRCRMFSRRAWKSVQFDVEVSSRYRPCVGTQASQSNFRYAEMPRSPVAVSITR